MDKWYIVFDWSYLWKTSLYLFCLSVNHLRIDSTDWWWLLKSQGLNTTQNTQYESWHTSWVITDIEVVMSVKTSNQLMSVYKLINIEVAMSVKYAINCCARTSSLWLTVKFLLLSQFEQQKFREKKWKHISHKRISSFTFHVFYFNYERFE